MSEKAKDLLLAVTLILTGLLALVAINTTRQTGIATTGALGFATLPSVYAGLLILLCLLLIGTVVFARTPPPLPRQDAGAAGGDSLTTATVLLRTGGTAALLLAYVLLLPHIPFILVTAAYLFVMFLLYGRRSLLRMILLSVLGGVGFHVLFVWALDLPL